MKNKKGNVNKLTGYALTFVVFALVLAMGFAVLTKFQLQQRTTGSAFDLNSTFTTLNQTAVDFSADDQLTCTDVNIWNSTNRANITDQFSISGCLATLENNNLNNTLMTANYTYTHYIYSASYNATSENVSGIQTLPTWIPIIIVALIGGVVLYIIIRQIG